MRSCLVQVLFHYQKFAKSALLIVAILTLSPHLSAQENACGQDTALQHSFNSGAAWSLCAGVSGVNGLQISNAFFRAPGDVSRSVMAHAQLSQILLHYHDRPAAEPQILPATSSTDAIARTDLLPLTDMNCKGQVLGTRSYPNSICQRVISHGILTKFEQRPSIQTQAWELSSAITRETLTWSTSWSFTEDGQIRPRLSLSGRSSRTNTTNEFAQQSRPDIPAMTRASILSTWRLNPSLDTVAPDSVERFDFPLEIDSENRRPMQITPLTLETFQGMDRENFRGWRIVDRSGAGYYLDPANNGFSYTSTTHNWPNAALALTVRKNCEQHASGNAALSTDTTCGTDLDEFVNGESLEGTDITVWFNQTRLLDPGVEDWPVIRDVQLGFDLLPFDWTATSPFELQE